MCAKRCMVAMAVAGGLFMLLGLILVITGAVTSSQLRESATAMIISGGVVLLVGIGLLLVGCIAACACNFRHSSGGSGLNRGSPVSSGGAGTWQLISVAEWAARRQRAQEGDHINYGSPPLTDNTIRPPENDGWRQEDRATARPTPTSPPRDPPSPRAIRRPDARGRDMIPTAPPVGEPPTSEEQVPPAPPPSYDAAVALDQRRHPEDRPSTPPPSYEEVVISYV